MLSDLIKTPSKHMLSDLILMRSDNICFDGATRKKINLRPQTLDSSVPCNSDPRLRDIDDIFD